MKLGAARVAHALASKRDSSPMRRPATVTALAATIATATVVGGAGTAVAGPGGIGTTTAQWHSSTARPNDVVSLDVSETPPYTMPPSSNGYMSVVFDPKVLQFIGHSSTSPCQIVPAQADLWPGDSEATCNASTDGVHPTFDTFRFRVSADTTPQATTVTAGASFVGSYGTKMATASLQITAIPKITGHARPIDDTEALFQGCADVMFVGIRGSGEPSVWGNEINPIANEVNRILPRAISLREVYVDYASASVPSILTNGYGQYFDSIGDGEIRLQRLLSKSASNCPNEKWIIAGYSQGALVANLVSRNWSSDPHLAALDLVADPNRFPSGSGINLGTATGDRGIYALGTRGASPLPASISRKTFSLCDSKDLVCDTNNPYYRGVDLIGLALPGTLVAAVDLAHLKHGIDVHTKYPERSFWQLALLGDISASVTRHAIGR